MNLHIKIEPEFTKTGKMVNLTGTDSDTGTDSGSNTDSNPDPNDVADDIDDPSSSPYFYVMCLRLPCFRISRAVPTIVWPAGTRLQSHRPIEPEAVFGDIKYNHGFKRFRLRSLPKVKVEFGLVVMAHNLRKYAKSRESATVAMA